MKKIFSLFVISILAAGMLAGCSKEETIMVQPTLEMRQETSSNLETVLESVSTTSQSGDNSAIISEDEAKKIALNDAAVKESDLTGIRVKLDVDNGMQEYEVDFYVGTKEYEYTISAEDGTILDRDYDIDDDFNMNNKDNSSRNNGIISLDDAIALVLSKVSGASKSDIRIHLDTDDGREIYEGSLVYQNKEYDFEINAQTGDIIEWEEESIYD